MANGTVKIPAFAAFLGGGVSVSNTAVLIGAGLLALGALVHGMWSRQRANEMNPIMIEQRIFDDVQDYSAYPAQVTNNADRVMDAIRRSTQLRELRNDYVNNIQSAVTAKNQALITVTEMRERIQKAREDYIAAIREKWKLIMAELGIGAGHASMAFVPSNGS